MNDRIKELAVQAGLMHILADHVKKYPGYQEPIEKFAELIVRECIDIAYREGDNVAYLALHFGVEE